MTDTLLPTFIHDLFLQLRHTVMHNQLAQGGLVLGALGAIAAAARSWPLRLWNGLVTRLTFTLEIDGQDASFAWLSVWLATQAGSRRMRHMGVATRFNERMGGLSLTVGTDQDGDEINVRLVPLSGQSLLRYRGHWLLGMRWLPLRASANCAPALHSRQCILSSLLAPLGSACADRR
jgi:mitochondrial chaperone BCS1